MVDDKNMLKTLICALYNFHNTIREMEGKNLRQYAKIYDHAVVPVPWTPSNMNNMFRVGDLAIRVVHKWKIWGDLKTVVTADDTYRKF